MATKCLICDESIPESHGVNAPIGKTTKKSRSEGSIPILSDAKAKFALTQSQYTILQKVLSLPVGACKDELILGPYCRDCFTSINNVCHCMSALENLQQSVLEFRKDFGSKMQKSYASPGDGLLKAVRKRKSNPGRTEPNYLSARSTILGFINSNAFTPAIPEAPSKPRNMHEVISNMGFDGSAPDTHIEDDQVVCTTNGSMPVLKRIYNTNGNKLAKNKTSSTSVKHTPPIPVLSRESTRSSLEVLMKPKEFKCWHCTQLFSTADELDAHEAVAHKHQCQVCSKGFSTPRAMKTHSQMHSASSKKNKSHSFCKPCNKQFGNKKSFTTHVTKVHHTKGKTKIAHAGDNLNRNAKACRPRRCKVCSKIIMDLQAHMKTEHPEIVTTQISDSTKIKKEKPDKVNNDSDNAINSIVKLESDDNVSIKPNELKTEVKEESKTSNSPSSSSTTPSTSPKRSVSFQIPSTASFPSPPQPQASASSKYQFKNLLKIGDK